MKTAQKNFIRLSACCTLLSSIPIITVFAWLVVLGAAREGSTEIGAAAAVCIVLLCLSEWVTIIRIISGVKVRFFGKTVMMLYSLLCVMFSAVFFHEDLLVLFFVYAISAAISFLQVIYKG